MDITEELRTVAFCAGYGGIERGLELAGQPCRVVAYSEIEAFAAANLVAKMETGALDPAPVWTDIKTFPMGAFRGKVDLLTGGFPCQPFSAAGARGADEDPRHLFPYFRQFAETVKPRFVFLENVDGIASAKLGGNNWADPAGTPVLLHVCRELERVGYRVAAGCFSAREVGAPHKRRRWFILGELANTNDSNGGTKQKREYKESPQEFCGGDKLADPRSPSQHGISQSSGRVENSEIREFSAKLDNPLDERLQRESISRNPHKNWTQSHDEQPLRQCRTGSKTGLWPAPPGPYQYEWEEPRTVHNPLKSQLGRAIDGPAGGLDATAHRVDRLRLCGNGVVPQTAAVAWTTLIKKLNT